MITNPPAVPISVTSLAVEVSSGCIFDYLTMNGVRYCGMPTVSLEGVVPDGTPIEWRTDGSVTKAGWELCFPPPPEDDSYETYDYTTPTTMKRRQSRRSAKTNAAKKARSRRSDARSSVTTCPRLSNT